LFLSSSPGFLVSIPLNLLKIVFLLIVLGYFLSLEILSSLPCLSFSFWFFLFPFFHSFQLQCKRELKWKEGKETNHYSLPHFLKEWCNERWTKDQSEKKVMKWSEMERKHASFSLCSFSPFTTFHSIQKEMKRNQIHHSLHFSFYSVHFMLSLTLHYKWTE